MKLKSVLLDDNEMPAKVAVTMTVDEAATIVAQFGKLADPAVGDIYRCLASVFNRFWENGVDGYLAGDEQ